MSKLNKDFLAVVLFDGVCNLCSNSVQFIIKRDPKARFKFASLQSAYGQAELTRFNLDPTQLHSIILVQGDTFLERSNAALEIARHLSGAWPLFYAFKIVPRFLRDPVYNWIARNRYRWFGRKNECWLPTHDLRDRFLDNILE
ncbi:MAG: thiol-disulfide oxidoreductase DCC family protein [Cyclobacteriaceae bacterium]|nr:thiol-disulfide oxidoreductase DCC family protein [Cyclobacteriaceae bacterium]MBX2957305.1 thiol-disulfide oxidoreductase DCC family protein [Cyclobacteriaceae bacterium]